MEQVKVWKMIFLFKGLFFSGSSSSFSGEGNNSSSTQTNDGLATELPFATTKRCYGCAARKMGPYNMDVIFFRKKLSPYQFGLIIVWVFSLGFISPRNICINGSSSLWDPKRYYHWWFLGQHCRRFDALGPGAPQPTNRHAWRCAHATSHAHQSYVENTSPLERPVTRRPERNATSHVN